MDSAKAAQPERSRDDETKRRLLLEYDAANFRDRHDLLDREGISVRDIARWRRETAIQLVSSGLPDPVALPVRPADPEPAATPPPAGDAIAAGDATATDISSEPGVPAAKPGRRSRRRDAVPEPGGPTGPLSALRSDVVAAHASALVYHADALARLASDATTGSGARRRRSASLERLIAAANQTKAAAREVLAGRRRSGAQESATRDSVDVSAELTDMLSKLTDYPSLAVAVQLLARELAPDSAESPAVARRAQLAERNRRPWWGSDDTDEQPTGKASRTGHAWGSRRRAGDGSAG
jgi:hypothetical protein